MFWQGVKHYVIKFVSDLRQIDGFLRTLRFPSPIKSDRHDIAEILFKEALNTITLTPSSQSHKMAQKLLWGCIKNNDPFCVECASSWDTLKCFTCHIPTQLAECILNRTFHSFTSETLDNLSN